MLDLLAQAAPPNQPQPFVGAIVQYLPLILVLVLLYVFVFNAKRKDDKNRRSMIDALKKGDKVQTIGGIIGTVLQVDGDEITVKVDESSNTKIKFIRSAIAKVTTDALKVESK